MRSLLVSWGPSILMVIAIWLAWQILSALLITRAPPSIALRVAPSSALTLARAAEAELVARRVESAAVLAARSLAIAPFQVRAVRILGLAEADRGRDVEADALLTLAGNWSLRDDPSHAWLVQRRLEQGNYRSAFGHADTIVRRRPDTAPMVFNLFTTAATLDERAEPFLAERLAVSPPWARGYLRSLYEKPESLGLLPRLAIRVETTPGRLDNAELGVLYRNWLAAGRIPGLTYIRNALDRPPTSLLVVDGDFSEDPGVDPFSWAFGVGPGLSVIVIEDDLRSDNTGLRIEYNGQGSAVLAEQLLLLKPGRYTLRGQSRAETPAPPRMEWTVACFETGDAVGRFRQPQAEAGQDWRGFQLDFVVPPERCTAQYLQLRPRPEFGRAIDIVWYDDIGVSPQTNADD